MNKEIRCLETILEYDLTDQEAKAYKLCCMFVEECQRLFPEQRQSAMPQHDPRKSITFKYCYKLLRETGHKLRVSQYKHYIHAQLAIIKSMTSQSGKDPYLGPSILTGEKAWNRWLIWQKKYADAQRKMATKKTESFQDIERIKRDLLDSKDCIQEGCGGLSRDHVRKAIIDHRLLRWIAWGKVSPYYAVLSPLVKEWVAKNRFDLDSLFSFDPYLYQKEITSDVQEFFKKEFRYEFV